MKKAFRNILTNKKARKITLKQALVKSANTDPMAVWL